MINNEFYRDLGERWYTSKGDAVALLRQENKTKLPWVLEQIREFQKDHNLEILDVGCGGGFLTLALSEAGYRCTGLDALSEVLAVGRNRDTAQSIRWVQGDACRLPFPDSSFDAVCIMDVLEHVDDARSAVDEALRVLRPGGLLLTHTFNRTWQSWLLADRALDWVIADSPRHIHNWKMFVKPSELTAWLNDSGAQVQVIRGIRPRLNWQVLTELLLHRRVAEDFQFEITDDLKVGYLLSAQKQN